MITITKEFTKEQLIKKAAEQIKLINTLELSHDAAEHAAMCAALLEIALASLNAKPVGEFYEADPGEWYQRSMGDRAPKWTPLYTAPPAPVSVPDERYQHLSELYHAQEKRLFKLAQRIKGPSFDKYAYSPSQAIDVLESAIFGESAEEDSSAAMLQGAEPVTTAYKLPDDFDFDRFNDVTWLEAVASNPHMHAPTTSTIAMVALELNKRLETGNSQVVPDGWVMVPIEPTEDMIVNGFESEPDESFSDAEVWEAYDAMSGCQQAAHRAKLCWSAMISAAPKPDVR